MHPFAVLFVCMGNVCRSPVAQAVFARRVADAGLAQQVRIDSVGTHAAPRTTPDPRAIASASQRGYRMDGLRARRLGNGDFGSFDLLLALDESNLLHLHSHCAESEWHRLHLLTAFCTRHPGVTAVPDPYYGNAQGFEHVLDLVEDACDGLLLHVKKQLLLRSPVPQP